MNSENVAISKTNLKGEDMPYLAYIVIIVVVFVAFRFLERKATGNTWLGIEHKDVTFANNDKLRTIEGLGLVAAAAIYLGVMSWDYTLSSIGLIGFVSCFGYITRFYRKFTFGFALSEPKPFEGTEVEWETLFLDCEDESDCFETTTMCSIQWLSCGTKVMFRNRVREVISRSVGGYVVTLKK